MNSKIPVKNSCFLQNISKVDVGIQKVGIKCDSLKYKSNQTSIIKQLLNKELNSKKEKCFGSKAFHYEVLIGIILARLRLRPLTTGAIVLKWFNQRNI